MKIFGQRSDRLSLPPMPNVRDFQDGWNFYHKAYDDALKAWERVSKHLIDAAHPRCNAIEEEPIRPPVEGQTP